MAGGGVTHSATDDCGYYGVEGQVHVNDLHATMLHLMGLVHERLTFEHHGCPFRLTDVAGKHGEGYSHVNLSAIFLSSLARLGKGHFAPDKQTEPIL